MLRKEKPWRMLRKDFPAKNNLLKEKIADVKKLLSATAIQQEKIKRYRKSEKSICLRVRINWIN